MIKLYVLMVRFLYIKRPYTWNYPIYVDTNIFLTFFVVARNVYTIPVLDADDDDSDSTVRNSSENTDEDEDHNEDEVPDSSEAADRVCSECGRNKDQEETEDDEDQDQ